MNENLINDMQDENSEWNVKRKVLEEAFLKAGAALLDHTLAAQIEMADFGVHVILKREVAGSVN